MFWCDLCVVLELLELALAFKYTPRCVGHTMLNMIAFAEDYENVKVK